MKGKIDKNGRLFIERRGTMKLQTCPFTFENPCGNWCPLFGNPEVSQWMGSPNPDSKDRKLDSKHWNLKLCQCTLFFEELQGDRT